MPRGREQGIGFLRESRERGEEFPKGGQGVESLKEGRQGMKLFQGEPGVNSQKRSEGDWAVEFPSEVREWNPH